MKRSIFLAIFFLIANALEARTNTYNLCKFKGITEIDIQINISERFKNETKLSEDRIKNLISLRFRQSGIKITEEASDTFSIDVSFAKAYCCSTYIKSELMSPARLERNNSFVYPAVWGNFQLISGGLDKALGNRVIEVIESFVDEFLNIYLEANPREFVPRTTLQINEKENLKGDL